jgi:hypothetical protein
MPGIFEPNPLHDRFKQFSAKEFTYLVRRNFPFCFTAMLGAPTSG